MSSRTFYADLAATTDFATITDATRYTSVPDDWVLVLSDVVNSTQAVRDGRYRAVNFVGAASIVALLNLAGNDQVPFVFGGDGATVLLPPELADAAVPVLQHLRRLAQSDYDLELRVGVVPVTAVRSAGFEIAVLKVAPTADYAQAMFHGGGLSYADRLIKHPGYGAAYRLSEAEISDSALDLTGLECRWQEVESPSEETLTLLVAATPEPGINPLPIYQTVMEQITAIYGSAQRYQPVSVAGLKISANPLRLWLEARLKASRAKINPLRLLLRHWLLNLAGIVFIRRGMQTGETDWSQYREHVQATTDFQKYDDLLRMVIAGTVEQRTRLTTWLDQQQQTGQLAYGTHVSSGALLTCLVFERMGHQVHFVDGSGGGYALASQPLKERLSSYTLLPTLWTDPDAPDAPRASQPLVQLEAAV